MSGIVCAGGVRADIQGLVNDLRQRQAVGARAFRMADDGTPGLPPTDVAPGESQQEFEWVSPAGDPRG